VRQRVLAVVLSVAALMMLTPDAFADRSVGKVDRDNDGVTVRAYREVTSAPHRGGTRTFTCTYREAGATPLPVTLGENLEFAGGHEGDFVEDHYYWTFCRNGLDALVSLRIFQYQPGVTPISAPALAAEAVDQLRPAFPVPQTNPDLSVDQIAGIETWLWVDPDDWQPVTATASVPPIGPFPGLTVTATAQPVQVIWDMGDGTEVVCDGPGTPYDVDRPAADQSTDCSHVYQRFGRYEASAIMVWQVSWSSSDGDGGTLANIARTTTFDIGVAERQAVGR